MVLTQEVIQRGIRDCKAVSCSDLHEGSCNLKFLQQFTNGCRSLYKLYLIVHFAPAVIFKTKRFRQNFLKELLKTMVGFLRSMVFAGLFPAISRRIMCWVTQFYGYEGNMMVVASGVGAMSLLCQSKGRQAEIALYCTTKTLEIIDGYLRRHGFLRFEVPYFSIWLFGFTMAIFGYYYQNEAESIKHSYQSALQKLLGPV